jgi:hypothetical protein
MQHADQACVFNLEFCLLVSKTQNTAAHSLIHMIGNGVLGKLASISLDNCDLIGAANGSTNSGMQLNLRVAQATVIDSIFYRIGGSAIANPAASTVSENFNAYMDVTVRAHNRRLHTRRQQPATAKRHANPL